VFAAIKEVSRESETLSFADAMERIRHRGFASVEALYSSEDQKEGARAFAAKRAPVWRGR
jgi:crotonobetainyl-CoA hydratase